MIDKNRPPFRPLRYTGAPLLLALLILLLTITVIGAASAQDGPAPPPRNIEREAPRRHATVLDTRPATGDMVNVVLEIPPAADTYIASRLPDSNFGDDALFVGFDATYGAERTLLWFDISGEIPDGVAINSASLRLHLSYANPPNDEPMSILVRDLRSSWTEQTVTWNTEPQWGDDWDISDVGTEVTFYSWDVSGLVQAWYDETLANNGLLLQGDEQAAQPSERAFYARETTTNFYPHLIVSYGTDVPDVRVDELPQYSPRTFTVSWTNHGPEDSLSHYDLQYRVDGGNWIDWLSEIPADVTSADFTGENGRLYEFRARGVQDGGATEPFGAAEASTTVDTAPPEVSVNPLPAITNDETFTVSWSGEDEGSGIAYYDLRFRFSGGQWNAWQQQTLSTSATFTAMRDGLFEFEARGVDEVGNVESFRGEAEANIMVDLEPPFIEEAMWLPAIFVSESE